MIKHPIIAVISFVLLLILIGYTANTVLFLQRAEYAQGIVTNVSKRNGKCKKRPSRHGRFSCTIFTASIQFSTKEGQRVTFQTSAGNTRGKDADIHHAFLDSQESVSVIYDPQAPTEAFRYSFFRVWGGVIGLLIAQISTLLVSILGRRRISLRTSVRLY